MKRSAFFLLALFSAAPWTCPANISGTVERRNELGNELPPGGHLRGETVYVTVGQTESGVDAIFDVSDFPSDTDAILLPIFASAGAKPGAVVTGARIRAALNGKALARISVASAPGGSPALPDHLQLVWARIDVSRDFRSKPQAPQNRYVRISYVQTHVDRIFYYLAQSIPTIPEEESGHNWRYSLFAQAGDRSLAFAVGDCTWERLGNALVVYLKSDQVVALEAR